MREIRATSGGFPGSIFNDTESIERKLLGFVDRPGGYTRIVKLGHRVGDGADVARIELLAE